MRFIQRLATALLLFILLSVNARGAEECAAQLHRVMNLNAQTDLIDYQHPYYRTWEEYQSFLPEFGLLPPQQKIIDVGGGLGVAAIELARLGHTVVVLNAQDFFGEFLRMADKDLDILFGQDEKAVNRQRVRRIGPFATHALWNLCIALGMKDPIIAESIPVHEKAHFAKLLKQEIQRMAATLRDLVASGRLQYKVGFAEEELPQFHNWADVLLDVFAGLTYSPDRVQLLELYQQAIRPGGMALVTLGHAIFVDYAVVEENSSTITLSDFLLREKPPWIDIRNTGSYAKIRVEKATSQSQNLRLRFNGVNALFGIPKAYYLISNPP